MRILQLVTAPQRRGAEVFAFALSGALRRRGHQASTLYLHRHDGPAALPLLPGDAVMSRGRHRPLRRLPRFDPRLLGRLARALRREGPDLVQLNGGPTVAYGALAARLQPSRGWAVLYRNIGDPDRWLAGRLRRAVYRRLVGPCLDGVVGVSAATLTTVATIYGEGIPRRQIPRAVDPEALAPTASREELRARLGTSAVTPVALFVGSLTPEKRVDLLLAAARLLRHSHPGFELWLVGDGPLRATLERAAAADGSAGRAARFLGARGDVGDFLHAADLLVLASDSEGMPGVVLEAGCVGLPVVATAVGGVAECVRDGETGLLVPPGDPAALAAAVATLLGDRQRAAAMGRCAAAWVAERFTVDRVAAEYEAFYGEVIARRRHRDGRR